MAELECKIWAENNFKIISTYGSKDNTESILPLLSLTGDEEGYSKLLHFITHMPLLPQQQDQKTHLRYLKY